MRFKKCLMPSIGFVFLGLGAIGVILPIWPTTPFVLVSVACFSSSPRIKAKIMKIPFFREHIENYNNRNGLSSKTLLISLIWLWGMLIISMSIIRELWAFILLSIVGSAVTTHILFVARPKDKGEKKE
ncbi:MAG: DUF454 domain-containing protein [Clostridiales bacterium]|nr:DUF454 domain-containing protein [Clostridiales bacterium]